MQRPTLTKDSWKDMKNGIAKKSTGGETDQHKSDPSDRHFAKRQGGNSYKRDKTDAGGAADGLQKWAHDQDYSQWRQGT